MTAWNFLELLLTLGSCWETSTPSSLSFAFLVSFINDLGGKRESWNRGFLLTHEELCQEWILLTEKKKQGSAISTISCCSKMCYNALIPSNLFQSLQHKHITWSRWYASTYNNNNRVNKVVNWVVILCRSSYGSSVTYSEGGRIALQTLRIFVTLLTTCLALGQNNSKRIKTELHTPFRNSTGNWGEFQILTNR